MERSVYLIIGLGVVLLLVLATSSIANKNSFPSSNDIKQPKTTQNPPKSTISPDPLVDPNKILSGGPPKDGIPSIDNPKFVTVSEADEWIEDDELGLAIIHKGTKRFYPLQILVWHEIVNDDIEEDPILITYCPLCGSGIAYERKINGEEVEFGTSGKLYNSNLVMYDRLTDSYWTQIGGRAIVGELTGTELKEVSIDTVFWNDWKGAHPDTQVLSKDTENKRNYGRDPYGSYYIDTDLYFPVENRDNRVHEKTVIFGIEIDNKFKAYPEKILIKENNRIEDNFNQILLLITRDEAGIVTIIRTDTNEEIIKERDFWFAWAAFHPETELYEGKQ